MFLDIFKGIDEQFQALYLIQLREAIEGEISHLILMKQKLELKNKQANEFLLEVDTYKELKEITPDFIKRFEPDVIRMLDQSESVAELLLLEMKLNEVSNPIINEYFQKLVKEHKDIIKYGIFIKNLNSSIREFQEKMELKLSPARSKEEVNQSLQLLKDELISIIKDSSPYCNDTKKNANFKYNICLEKLEKRAAQQLIIINRPQNNVYALFSNNSDINNQSSTKTPPRHGSVPVITSTTK